MYIVSLFQEFPPLLQTKEWTMAESKQPYKTKAFPCALCCLTVPEVKELMERLHKHKEATEMENLKESGTLKT